MKKSIQILLPVAAFIGLPAAFISAAFHEATPQIASGQTSWWEAATAFQATYLVPALFFITLLTVVLIMVHHLREDQRLASFSHLYLRLSASQEKASLAKGKAVLARVVTV